MTNPRSRSEWQANEDLQQGMPHVSIQAIRQASQQVTPKGVGRSFLLSALLFILFAFIGALLAL